MLCYRPDLTKAIEKHASFKSLLRRIPNAKLYLKWQPIFNQPKEKIPFNERVWAIHIHTLTKHARSVNEVLNNIYDKLAKRGFPLDIKFSLYTNGGVQLMSVGCEGAPTLKEKGRNKGPSL